MPIDQRIPTSVGTLALADEGSGVAVICWPSLFADHRFYAPLRDALGDGWRCIRIDGPGFGQNSVAGFPVDVLARMLDRCGGVLEHMSRVAEIVVDPQCPEH